MAERGSSQLGFLIVFLTALECTMCTMVPSSDITTEAKSHDPTHPLSTPGQLASQSTQLPHSARACHMTSHSPYPPLDSMYIASQSTQLPHSARACHMTPHTPYPPLDNMQPASLHGYIPLAYHMTSHSPYPPFKVQYPGVLGSMTQSYWEFSTFSSDYYMWVIQHIISSNPPKTPYLCIIPTSHGQPKKQRYTCLCVCCLGCSYPQGAREPISLSAAHKGCWWGAGISHQLIGWSTWTQQKGSLLSKLGPAADKLGPNLPTCQLHS